MFLPPYSSELNPIERLWSLVKRRWTKSLFMVTEELTRFKVLRSINMRAVQKVQALIGKGLKIRKRLKVKLHFCRGH